MGNTTVAATRLESWIQLHPGEAFPPTKFTSSMGFYFDSLIVVLTVYTILRCRLYLALNRIEKAAMNSSDNGAFGTILNQQFIIQLGPFTALPMIVENSLEHGFLPFVGDFLTRQLQLAYFFIYILFRNSCPFFGRTILHGGAKYRATGSCFVVQQKSFAENYIQYARCYSVKAIELEIILIVYAFHSHMAKYTFVYKACHSQAGSFCLLVNDSLCVQSFWI
ncbi:hypothetical protein Dsin_013043 [Dipteronia sinensis]|uniref:Glycosyl transferase 48 domain-containing protein n=1 Tax=Dipteronia sinensis TaxID=43782 RepID=A0AAE0AJ74_9ROSI|nr:hypothetical protein Dsin_013043 [Dipteronia sinensis]